MATRETKVEKYLALRHNCGGRRLSNFGLWKPVRPSFSMPFQPVAESKDESISLCGCKSQLVVVGIHVPAVWQKTFLLALQHNHVSVIYQIGCPMLVPSRSELHMRKCNQISLLVRIRFYDWLDYQHLEPGLKTRHEVETWKLQDGTLTYLPPFIARHRKLEEVPSTAYNGPCLARCHRNVERAY